MLAFNRIFNQLRRTIAIAFLAGLIFLTSLPASAQAVGDSDYVESGKRAAEVIPKDLGTGSRQKNPVEMLKRFGSELTNEPQKRSFGAKDYERSEIEQELARNKAQRGDYDANIEKVKRETSQ
ncbi:hypothetical protein PI95_025750 [Hassallia byssoidea VB512170]|uniref:Uncharacterized protein n=1 Tax=Hassallia byssoidea VB512170 TaxID=1304833 RepID=A0A846HFZ3_9CYAN|nr:hypothetical protein [Hassalia byssoidea]NEU75868.1 hypothetical protein [Hassalia byssoidea VB512170]